MHIDVPDTELERRKQICRTCPDFRGDGAARFWCARECHREDGAYCEPWGQQRLSKRFLGEEGPCLHWQAEPFDVYHTNTAFQSRLTARRATPIVPTPLAVFYHIACMANWQHIFDEQSRTFDEVGLLPQCCVLGTPEDVAVVRKRFPVIYEGPSVKEYETPTLQRLWGWSRENRGGAVLYVHTKGASAPHDANKTAWRRLMTDHLVRRWRDHIEALSQVDMVGVDWIDSPDLRHFSGNFWMARADWLASLPSPHEHRASRVGQIVAFHPWERTHAEFWIGSRGYHYVRSVACRGRMPLWEGPLVFTLNPASGSTVAEIYCGLGHRTDKGTGHSYLSFYDKLFFPLKGEPTRIVEIGIGDGGSLDLWDRYFTHPNSRIFGVDVHVPSFTSGRIQAVQAMHDNACVAALVRPVDVVIDDASHDPEDQASAFRIWWRSIRPGGLYVIEDLRDDAAVASMMQIHPFTEVDLRHVKGRADDRILWARKPAEASIRPIYLGTSVTDDYLPKAEPFLRSLAKTRARRFCVCFGFWASPALRAAYPETHFAPMPRTCCENYGMIQWGAWLDALPHITDDELCIISDADMVIQREISDTEADRFDRYDGGTIGLGFNAGPDDTLANEAGRIGLTTTDLYPGEWSQIPVYNDGVMVARAGLFRKLRSAYDREAESFYRLTSHRSRCQWLISYLVDRLGLRVDRLPTTIHANNHFGLPAECSQANGLVYCEGEPVAFAHHF